MSIEFLKTLLNYNFYDKHKSLLTEDLLPKDLKGLYTTIINSHKDNKASLTSPELRQLHLTLNPALPQSAIKALDLLLVKLEEAPVFDEKVQETILHNMVTSATATELASLAIDISDNKATKPLEYLQTLVNRLSSLKNKTEEQESTKIDLNKIINLKTISLKWKFNLTDIQSRLTGIGPGYFGIIAARPDAGKTSFYMALTAGLNGFLDQGAKCLVIGNEESTDRLKTRALSAASGLADTNFEEHKTKLNQRLDHFRDRFDIADGFGMTMGQLDTYLTNHPCDILIIDQLDKMGVNGSFGNDVERLKKIYIAARDLAKKHKCAVIGVCQAGVGAHNRLFYGFEHLDGSKTGKAAECDWCITIGMEIKQGEGDNGYRMANFPKNKITGNKQPVPFVLDTDICQIHP